MDSSSFWQTTVAQLARHRLLGYEPCTILQGSSLTQKVVEGIRGVARASSSSSLLTDREFFIDNLLVRIHFINVMIRWTGLAPWEFEFPFPGSRTSTFIALLTRLDTSDPRGYAPCVI